MWLRLSYLSLPEALKGSMRNGAWYKSAISGRYKAELRRQFHMHGLPWIYDPPRDDSKNPRHKKPKGHKR